MDNKHDNKNIFKGQGYFKEKNMKCRQMRICSGCDQPISDRFLFCVNDVYWHETCLQCNVCHCSLTDSCYSKENKLFCSSDYRRLFAAKCSTCKQDIAANELVMRAHQNVYHLHCFKCDECGRTLEKGDEFGLKDRRLYCKDDLQGMKREKGSVSDSTLASDKSELSPAPSDLSCDTKSPKRPRTILTSSQRKAFKASFEMTPKPCRKVREELSRDTGLSVRVVQVWFQNQRAKLKKIAKKNNPNHLNEHSAKINAKAKKKTKTKIKAGNQECSKKSSFSQSSTNDSSPSATTTYTNQMQPFEQMIARQDSYPLIPPPNLQPFYTSSAQRNSGHEAGFSSISQSDLPPPPYTMTQANYRVQESILLDNRMSGFLNFENGMGSSFLEQIERGRPNSQYQLMNQTLNSY